MWKLTDGCVIILVTGRNPERFLNLLRGEGIEARQVCTPGRDVLQMQIPAKAFRRIRPIVQKCGCRVHILSRSGLVFSLNRLIRRPVLLYGTMASLLMMAFLSTRILSIRVTGNEKIPQAVILRALEEQGIKRFGAKPKGTTLLELAQNARMYDPRIAWIGLFLHGAVLTADVVEMSQDVPLLDPQAQCDAVAVKDGRILRLRVYEGRAAVEEGDSVSAGDVIINGAYLGDSSKVDQMEVPMRVHARGEVLAEVTYTGEYAAEAEKEVLTDSGRTAPSRELLVMGKKIAPASVPFSEYETRERKEISVSDFLVPVTLITGISYEQTVGTKALSYGEQREEALYGAEQMARLKIPEDAAVVSKQAELIETEGLLIGRVTIVTNESIGLEKELEN